MEDFHASSALRSRNQVFVWDRKFETRQKHAYRTEEGSLIQELDQTALTAFLHEKISRLDPPSHNHTNLQAFLSQVCDADLLRDPPLRQDTKIVALVDERCDNTGWLDVTGKRHAGRDWGGYVNYPPTGEVRPPEMLNAHDLYKKLQTSTAKAESSELHSRHVSISRFGTRVKFVSPTGSHSARFLATLCCSSRVLWSSYGAWGIFGLSTGLLSMYLKDFEFAMEFHLPYYALRRSTVPRSDTRGLRRCVQFNPPRPLGQSPEYLYEAQISVIVTGVDEWFWTTYCRVDKFFGSEEDIKFYYERGLDAPTGGLKPAHYPEWNPRQYFLLILYRRFRQITKEWGNVVHTLEGRLHDSRQKTSLIDDPDLTRTHEYTWTVQLLRVLHNSLVKIIESWKRFERGELRYFQTEEPRAFHMLWSKYLAGIEKDLTELRYLRRSLQQMLEMFDNMRDGVSTIFHLHKHMINIPSSSVPRRW
ncbi:hypothetical protein MMC30_004397 [Trapelia coarctata]|nr:hypothetical protein [Trapelia coarctata]